MFDKRVHTQAFRIQSSSREVYASYWTLPGASPIFSPFCEDSHLFSLLPVTNPADLVCSVAEAAGKRNGSAPDGDA